MRRDGTRFELWGLSATLVLHGSILVALATTPPPLPRPRTTVEVDIRKREPPPPPPPIPPPEPQRPPPEPERKIVKKPEVKPAQTPRPSQEPPKEPPKAVQPVQGLSKDQLSKDGTGAAIAEGNTTLADPNKRPKGPVEPLPPAQGAPGKEFRPVAEAELKSLPAHDTEACVAGMKEKYSRSEAYAAGVEGEVVFRIDLDDTGKIRDVRKVKGVNKELDAMAYGWLRFNPRCKFGPAIARDGKPAAFVIERYSITFEQGQ